MLLRSLPLVLATVSSSAPAAARQSAPDPVPSILEDGGVPWLADRALGTPPWLSVSGSVQTRFESMSNRLRRGETGSNQGFFNRVLTEFTLRDRFFELNAELIDARIFGEPDDATPTTGQVDTADLLQGYVAGTFTDAFESADELRVLAGRHTIDLGSRRLIARNIYRNTINAFTGVNALWSGSDGMEVGAFATLPVYRRPENGEFERLDDGDPEFDVEEPSVRFWGLHAHRPDTFLGGALEAYYLGLFEADAPGLQTRDRRLATFGARLHRAPARGAVHYELETAWQAGHSKLSSAPTATEELAHRAYMHVAHVGYTFDHDTRPRLEALFEMTSGDRDPGDGNNERFDALYGAPRGDLGPTGLFRAIARVNLVSPGLRFVMRPVPEVEVLLMQRFNYLASDRDAWSTGYQDPTGRSGSHIGNLSELRVRYDIVPKGLRFEVGAAYHAAGSFAETAPDAVSPNDALFGYVQTTFWF